MFGKANKTEVIHRDEWDKLQGLDGPDRARFLRIANRNAFYRDHSLLRGITTVSNTNKTAFVDTLKFSL